jgi:transposase
LKATFCALPNFKEAFMPNLYADFIGIDVSKNKLDVYATKNKKYYSVSNDKKGINSLLKLFEPSPDLLVLIDLTGGYEAIATDAFFKAGFSVHKARGLNLKQFTRSFGQKAKTDKIDAKMLTVYGAKMQESLRLYQPDDNQLKELVSRRQDLKDMLQKEKNRMEHFQDKAAKRSLSSSISFLKKQIEDIELEIKERIDKDKELKEKAKVIDSVKSVGDNTTMILLAALPELGRANRREIAALAGVAPYANDSGALNKRRMTSSGRPLVKKTLFMCALVAIVNNAAMRTFYKKLVSNGKQKMVAIVAVMRKLIVIINNACKAFYLQRTFNGA